MMIYIISIDLVLRSRRTTVTLVTAAPLSAGDLQALVSYLETLK